MLSVKKNTRMVVSISTVVHGTLIHLDSEVLAIWICKDTILTSEIDKSITGREPLIIVQRQILNHWNGHSHLLKKIQLLVMDIVRF